MDGELVAEAFDGNEPALLKVRDVIKNRALLQTLSVALPEGGALTMDGLREFAASAPFYTVSDNDVLVGADGTKLTPIMKRLLPR